MRRPKISFRLPEPMAETMADTYWTMVQTRCWPAGSVQTWRLSSKTKLLDKLGVCNNKANQGQVVSNEDGCSRTGEGFSQVSIINLTVLKPGVVYQPVWHVCGVSLPWTAPWTTLTQPSLCLRHLQSLFSRHQDCASDPSRLPLWIESKSALGLSFILAELPMELMSSEIPNY